MSMATALVIGGGFYGCEIARELRAMGVARVILCERERGLLRRASFVNQARIHNGYHYPRSIATGMSCRENYRRFLADYPEAVAAPFTNLYAIAVGSRVTPPQFERFCAQIGAPCAPAAAEHVRLFDDSLIEAVYRVEETVFDAGAVARTVAARLHASGVEVRLGAAAHVREADASGVAVSLGGDTVRADWVFNCTYAELDAAGAEVGTPVKRELAEIALIDPPPDLAHLGVTVMDGAFFSTVPFPAMGCHSLTHVRHTPHASWFGGEARAAQPLRSNATAMLRDAMRYLPRLSAARYRSSLFEVKAVLLQSEASDGRPILFERSRQSPRIVNVLGGKIDNIYDVLVLIRSGQWRT